MYYLYMYTYTLGVCIANMYTTNIKLESRGKNKKDSRPSSWTCMCIYMYMLI